MQELFYYVTGVSSREGNSEEDNNSTDELAALKQPTMWLGAQDGRYNVILVLQASYLWFQ